MKDPNSAEATETHFHRLDEAEVQQSRHWTTDRIRDHHADLLEAKASQPGIAGEQIANLMAKARVARADAEAIRNGETTTAPVPPTFH